MNSSYPKLAQKGRLKFDKVREKHLLLLPEKVVVLNETAASILALCNGNDSIFTITEKMRSSLVSETNRNELPNFETMKADITKFVLDMVDQGWVVMEDERVKEL
ncbi:pyrroloquinoline quinone biosynthesis peptide chaperone PqqD [Bacillus timonensis]|uniref:pyrroloquinoline quinone biosynthesis peptide chaperone PqqD n=1 Tax=Bacillus timonensis TaxID=1033734 RepID=UPI0002884228|nr:pyrroloquinoline quinone biosynthesis peptide chaperone PqqD [Bacillus timonensis]